MSEFKARAKELHVVARAAYAIDAKPEVLACLTDYAALLVAHEHTTEAAHLLATILNHPDVPFDTYDRADDLWLELEGRLSARVIQDARDAGKFMTLRGAMNAAFALLDSPDDENDTSA